MTESERLVLLLGCKVTLILGVVATLTLLAGRRWPQSRALWQRLGILALLVLPVAASALLGIGIPVLSTPHSAAGTGEAWRAWQMTTLFRPVESFPATPDGEAEIRSDLPLADRGRFPVTGSGRTGAGLRAFGRSSASRRSVIFAAAYCVVVAALAMRFVLAWRGLTRLKRTSIVVCDPAWQRRVIHWSTVLRIRRAVELRTSVDISVPMTFGWRVPVILVPDDCISTCDETQRDAIVIHELTHIAHGDFFWQTLTRFTASLYWLHPLMWFVRRQNGTLCERICDILCSRHLSRESYAQALVRIAGRNVLRPSASLGMAMAHRSSLGRRLTDLTVCEPLRCSRPNRVRRAIQGVSVFVILGFIVVGTLTSRSSTLEAKVEASVKGPNSPSLRLPGKIEGQILDEHDKPIAKASVVISIVSNDGAREPALPKPWTATTDARGRYVFATNGLTLGADDFFSIKIQAEGFAELQSYYQGEAGAQGALPVQRLHTARKITGRLVDPDGKPVTEAVVRFQASSSDLLLLFDSGPLPVDKAGAFSASIPKAGKAAFAVYPRAFAPRIVEVPEDGADLGPVRVDAGTSLTGRVVDKEGHGVAGTVVAIQGESDLRLFLFTVLIATAVKTDENGSFTLPPVRGTYKVWVTGDAPDYSRRIVVTGAKPPPILPERIEFDGTDKTEEIEFREAVSITVQGAVRRADGSPVPNVEISSSMLPPGWQMGVNLASARTNAEGRYTLKLPSPILGVHISASQSIRAPNGKYLQFKAAGTGADPRNQNRTIRFDLLDADAEDADWLVDSEE